MADAVLIQPDRKFIREVAAAGGGDLKKCFQCATCSAVCALSDGTDPFPRKEIHWAQWGLKSRLLGDPDVWLCHQCNDCSVHCPRGARPGDIVAAVRALVVRNFAVPSALAGWLSRPGFLLAAFVVPAALLAAALLLRPALEAGLGITSDHAELYAAFFPHWLLITFFTFFTVLAIIAASNGLIRFWHALQAHDAARDDRPPAMGMLAAVGCTLLAIVTHRRFAECKARSSRRLAHLGVFFGFLALLVVTIWAVFDLYLFPRLGIPSSYPFPWQHPMKLLANVGGLGLLAGIALLMISRRRQEAITPASSTFDWYFLWLLLGVAVTGFVVEVLRFSVTPLTESGLRTTAYAIYFLHLVLVFQLLVFLPFTKFAHILYRTVAMVYAERTGRHRQLSRRLA